MTVSLAVENVTDLFSAPLRFKFDPNVLRLDEVTRGGFLAGDGRDVLFTRNIQNDTGDVTHQPEPDPGRGRGERVGNAGDADLPGDRQGRHDGDGARARLPGFEGAEHPLRVAAGECDNEVEGRRACWDAGANAG